MELDDRELQRLKKLVPYKVLAPTPDEICNEIERLHSIIKEVREYIEENKQGTDCCGETYIGLGEEEIKDILEILDKVDKENNNESNIF